MKRVLFITTVLLSLTMDAQEITYKEAESFADQLVQKEILNRKGKEKLLQDIRDNAIEMQQSSTVRDGYYDITELSKETILQFCTFTFFGEQIHRLNQKRSIEREVVPEDSLLTHQLIPYPHLSMLSGKYSGFIHKKRSTIGYTRTRTLEEFKEIGLISDRVYQECKQALLDASVTDEVQLLGMMTKRSLYYRNYDFALDEQKEYIDNLTAAEIFSKEGRNMLLQSYQPYELKSIPQMLLFSSRYALVELTAVDAQPKIFYPLIFQAIQRVLPGFQYEDLKVTTHETPESDLIRVDLKLRFKVGGNEYSHLFFHHYRKQVPDSSDREIPPSKVDQDFHKGINKWLTDIESPYRLYTVNLPDKDEGAYGGRRVGLLLLKKGEEKLFSKIDYLLSRESFDNRLSRRNIDKLIEEFTEQGFFAHLTAKELQEAKEKLASSDIGSLEDVLLAFPKTIVRFDWETVNLQNPYEDLTRQFAAASRGSFSVSGIIDEYSRNWKKAKRVKYGFTLNGRKYETLLEFNDDWLDPQFMELLKKALKENQVNGDIYYCIDNGQEGGYIFLTFRQHQFIKEKYPDLLKEQ